MCSPPFTEKLVHLYRKARGDPLDGALMAFGEVVGGIPGFLVCNGFVIHPRAAGVPIVSGDGTAIDLAELIDCPDLVINYLGLCVGRVSASEPDRFTTSLAILAIRLGILSRILDMAY